MQTLLEWKRYKYYEFWACVCNLRYSACNAHAPYCHLWPDRLQNSFSTLSHKRQEFRKKKNYWTQNTWSREKLGRVYLVGKSYSRNLVQSTWKVMAHSDVREGKWRGNWRMQWVASTLHTTSEHGVSSIRVRLKCDGTRWRTGGEVKGKLANAVDSQYPSHYLGTWCIQH